MGNSMKGDSNPAYKVGSMNKAEKALKPLTVKSAGRVVLWASMSLPNYPEDMIESFGLEDAVSAVEHYKKCIEDFNEYCDVMRNRPDSVSRAGKSLNRHLMKSAETILGLAEKFGTDACEAMIEFVESEMRK